MVVRMMEVTLMPIMILIGLRMRLYLVRTSVLGLANANGMMWEEEELQNDTSTRSVCLTAN